MSDILKFSVVIPVYNGSNTVTRAVDSCLKQTTLPWEIIIVNHCSTFYDSHSAMGCDIATRRKYRPIWSQ